MQRRSKSLAVLSLYVCVRVCVCVCEREQHTHSTHAHLVHRIQQQRRVATSTIEQAAAIGLTEVVIETYAADLRPALDHWLSRHQR